MIGQGTSSVYDLFQAALRRRREEMRNAGPLVRDVDDALACFAITRADDVVVSAEYRCTTCATLVAVCELLKQRAERMPVDGISRWEARDVREWLPGIPQSRWSRVEVALHALQSACGS